MDALTNSDTIAAIATPPGQGGVGIIRISGPEAVSVATAICGSVPAPRFAAFRKFLDRDGDAIDQGLVLFFSGPHSFTGEDVVEFHGHGGSVVLNYLLQQILDAGARLAQPGEFSRRAFLNDKIDLLEAEAIADLIASQSVAAVKLATRTLQGVFSRRIHELLESLTSLRVFVEAALDFPEEEIDFLEHERVSQDLENLLQHLDRTIEDSRHGRALREGLDIVIAGMPNAGKSTLLNTLSGRDTAIVTDIAGTTRDVLREHILIDDIPVHIIDTAGLRQSEDPVEKLGIDRAWQALCQADMILYLVDAVRGWTEQDQQLYNALPRDIPAVKVYTKIDLLVNLVQGDEQDFYLSAKTGTGMDRLKGRIRHQAGLGDSGEGVFLARQRHLDALNQCRAQVLLGLETLRQDQGAEFLAEELRLAQAALARITGEFTNDDLLGEIFSSFCIGK